MHDHRCCEPKEMGGGRLALVERVCLQESLQVVPYLYVDGASGGIVSEEIQ